MTVKVPNEAERNVLDIILTSPTIITGGELRLYKNDYTPVAGSTAADFTEADYSGYEFQTPGFTTPFTENGEAKALSGGVLFVHNGGGTSNTIYGYYFVWPDPDIVIYAERFDSSKSMGNSADSISLSIDFCLREK